MAILMMEADVVGRRTSVHSSVEIIRSDEQVDVSGDLSLIAQVELIANVDACRQNKIK